MNNLRRATRDRSWQLQGLAFVALNFRDFLKKRAQEDTLEWVALALFYTIIFDRHDDPEQDAKRIRYRIARLLQHCWQHGDELPSATHLSFDAAYKALGVEVTH